MKKKFVTIFPQFEDVHLLKDVGIIPYLMDKIFDYDGYVACYDTDILNNNKEIFKYLKFLKIKKQFKNDLLNEILFLIKESKKIDILNIYCFSKESLIKIVLYKTIKFITGKTGIIYLKLDTDSRIKKHKINSSKSIKYFLISKILKLVDLISVESSGPAKFLNENWPVKVEYIPNGFYDFNNRNIIDINTKENIILTVGRIGSEQKATEILLEAFKNIADKIPDWNLKIIGPIEKNFQENIDKYFTDNKELKNRVIFTGNITNKTILEDEYQRAKIFCLPSRWESFGLVLVEALSNGCRIISSDLESTKDILKDGKFGDVFPIDNIDVLSEKLLKNCTKFKLTTDYCNEAQNFAYKNFYWPNIISKLNSKLK